MPREDESNSPVKCGFCYKELRYKRNLRNHIDNVHGKDFPEKSILVTHDKQRSIQTYCSPKKPRLNKTTENTSDAGTMKIGQDIIEDVLSGDEAEEVIQYNVETPIEKSDILTELKKVIMLL